MKILFRIGFMMYLFGLLYGCALGPPKPDTTPVATSVQTIEVPTPYPVPCIAAKDVPPVPVLLQIDVKASDPEQRNAAIIEYAEALHRYKKLVSGLVDQCVIGDSNVKTPDNVVAVPVVK
jgi:hypothetical protein